MRVEPKTIVGIVAATHNHCYEQYTVYMTNWLFYLNCVRTGVAVRGHFLQVNVFFQWSSSCCLKRPIKAFAVTCCLKDSCFKGYKWMNVSALWQYLQLDWFALWFLISRASHMHVLYFWFSCREVSFAQLARVFCLAKLHVFWSWNGNTLFCRSCDQVLCRDLAPFCYMSLTTCFFIFCGCQGALYPCVAIGNSKRHVRKASHRRSKQQ